jgi:hypothetical protein
MSILLRLGTVAQSFTTHTTHTHTRTHTHPDTHTHTPWRTHKQRAIIITCMLLYYSGLVVLPDPITLAKNEALAARG